MMMPKVSVFTPTHNARWLDECYESLRTQTFKDWEWVVATNRATTREFDPRMRLVDAGEIPLGVGHAKRIACVAASGEILVELDHDDILVSSALAEIVDAFDAHPEAGFVYSDCAQMLEDGSRDESKFDLANGWEYYDTNVAGRSVLAVSALEASPHNMSYIWFAPNHVRAFRRDTYEAVGGYDAKLDVLDDQDIMCKLYQHSGFVHIPKCLYLQRMHDSNTQRDRERNARIQVETIGLYDRHVEQNALAWTERMGFVALDLGAAHNKPPQYVGVDKHDGPGVDLVADITHGLDMPDSSVGVIRAVDFLEHVEDKVALFNELYRVLAHGGMLLSLTPSTDGRGAFQDPTHVAYYNENSFWYFTEADYARFVPELKCRFQVSRLVTYHPSPWHEEHRIPYVCANLIAIKDGPRQGGRLFI